MIAAETEKEYRERGFDAWLQMSRFAQVCPETAQKEINQMFEIIRKSSPGKFLTEMYRSWGIV